MSKKAKPEKATENEPEMKNDTVDLQEALALLGVSRATLYNKINAGIITPLPKSPITSRRGRLRFRRADIEKLLRDF